MMSNKSILRNLSEYQPILLEMTPMTAAVMIILLVDETGDFEIVLTKRSRTLQAYAGHYSFPGGFREKEDLDLYKTAIRETQEELQLMPDSYDYIGQLDDFQDRYGNLVRPFITLMNKTEFEKKSKISDDEISEIYYLPLTQLDQIKDDPHLHAITRRRPSYAYTHGTIFIWGLTANILVHLLNVIANKSKPLGKRT